MNNTDLAQWYELTKDAPEKINCLLGYLRGFNNGMRGMFPELPSVIAEAEEWQDEMVSIRTP
jgi:hypothetical protein